MSQNTQCFSSGNSEVKVWWYQKFRCCIHLLPWHEKCRVYSVVFASFNSTTLFQQMCTSHLNPLTGAHKCLFVCSVAQTPPLSAPQYTASNTPAEQPLNMWAPSHTHTLLCISFPSIIKCMSLISRAHACILVFCCKAGGVCAKTQFLYKY